MYYYKHKTKNGYLAVKEPLTETVAAEYDQITEEQFRASRPQVRPIDPQKVLLRKEQHDILEWFKFYDTQIAQHQRCLRLGLVYDNKYGTIEELDLLAAAKANRLNEIKTLLNQ